MNTRRLLGVLTLMLGSLLSTFRLAPRSSPQRRRMARAPGPGRPIARCCRWSFFPSPAVRRAVGASPAEAGPAVR